MRAGEGKLPGHTLALSMARVWEAIREQRDLNLPAHKVRPLRLYASSSVLVAHSAEGCLAAEQPHALKQVHRCRQLGINASKKLERKKCSGGAGDGGQHPLRRAAGGAAALACL